MKFKLTNVYEFSLFSYIKKLYDNLLLVSCVRNVLQTSFNSWVNTSTFILSKAAITRAPVRFVIIIIIIISLTCNTNTTDAYIESNKRSSFRSSQTTRERNRERMQNTKLHVHHHDALAAMRYAVSEVIRVQSF